MDERSPVQILGDILDEVEGLRRLDSKSYLPESLVREARAVFDTPSSTAAVASNSNSMLRSADELEGRTVLHVFDSNLKRGDLLIACSDGTFLVLEAEPDGDDAYITTDRGYGRGDVADYLAPSDLVTMGLMTREQQLAAEHEDLVKKARSMAERMELQAKSARAALEKIEASAPVNHPSGNA